jgi:hypothetical protein
LAVSTTLVHNSSLQLPAAARRAADTSPDSYA